MLELVLFEWLTCELRLLGRVFARPSGCQFCETFPEPASAKSRIDAADRLLFSISAHRAKPVNTRVERMS
jgi:hypothetical protein